MRQRDDDNARYLNPINQAVRVITQRDTAGIMADVHSDFGAFAQSFRRASGYIAEITCNAVTGFVLVKLYCFAKLDSGVVLPDEFQLLVFFSKSSISENTSS